METMKAVRFHHHGGPDKLVYEDAPMPVAGEGEALLQVLACGINRLDLWVRQGIPAYPVTLPHISGADICGKVVSGDALPAGIAVGDEVLVYPSIFDVNSRAASLGHEELDPGRKTIGGHVNGGYAQFVAVPSRNLIKKPAQFTPVQGAAFGLTFLTAWHMLATRAELKKSETVLVLGASAGMGVAGIQVARYLGAHVIAATTSPEKADRLMALGADQVVVGHPQDQCIKALELTKGLGADVVFDHVGPATWDTAMRAVAPGGRIVTCGSTSGPEVPLNLRQLFGRGISILGSSLGTVAELQRLVKLAAGGTLTPVIDKVFPLAQAREAQEAMLAKDHVGKIVLSIT